MKMWVRWQVEGGLERGCRMLRWDRFRLRRRTSHLFPMSVYRKGK